MLEKKSGTQLERIKKSLQKALKGFGLVWQNLRIVNYLNITLDLDDGSFKPYRKPDDNIQYINKESNHPPNLIKHLPAYGFQTTFLTKTSLKNQQFIMKMHYIKQATWIN